MKTVSICAGAAAMTMAACLQAASIDQVYYALGESGSYNTTDGLNRPVDGTGHGYDFAYAVTAATIDTTNYAPAGGSTASYYFNGNSGYYQNWYTPYAGRPTANYGVEFWFKVSQADLNQSADWVFGAGAGTGYGGSVDLGGLGIYMSNGKVGGVAPGFNYVGSADIIPDQWMHVAIVTVNNWGIGFYVNGQLIERNGWGVAQVSTQRTAMSVNHNGTSLYKGWLDEAHIFTWDADGYTFNLPVPEPTTLGLLAAGAGLMLRGRK